MSKRREKTSLEDIIRQRGAPARPSVDAFVAEVRSCMVAPMPKPTPKKPDGLLGGILVMWEWSLPYSEADEFHEFIRKNENYITDSIKNMAKGAYYRGTYLHYGPGEPRYRTIWAYESPEVMAKVWTKALRDKNSNFYKAVRQLRTFWLMDPNRDEARWVPSIHAFDADEDNGDAFARLTLDAANPKKADNDRQQRPGRRGR